MKSKNLQPILYSLLIIIGIVIGNYINKPALQSNTKNEKINGILDLIQDHYVDTINSEDFNDKVINAILDELDPHSAYINPEKFKGVEQDMQGSFSGIGVQFNIIDDSIVVVAAISGGPSEKLGIQSGDRIVEVEGENVASINIKNEGVIKRLRGKKGTTVEIKILRRGNISLVDFAIVRDDIPLYSVDASIMLSKDIGYIKVNRFSATTFDEFSKGANKLLSSGMQKLILDLRGNPGGYLAMAISMCDAMLDKDNLIVYTQGRNRARENVYATKNGILQNTEIIVLIDEGSASASEIVSGAIQDNDRGLVIGRRSFGKGLVQEQIGLNDGSVVRLTTQRYYTPSGRCIQKNYGKNDKEYYTEPYLRNDEDIVDTLVFTTKKGRTVYGGGGITPDIIIKRDTAANYLQINLMVSKGWVNEFCLKHSFTLKNTETEISKKLFIASENQDEIYALFLAFVTQKDKALKVNIGEVELTYFKNMLKATIARNLWNAEVYYTILSQEDEFLQKAINSF
jgi:carboxyl-terminal processing protease